jgi:hypothetical protein
MSPNGPPTSRPVSAPCSCLRRRQIAYIAGGTCARKWGSLPSSLRQAAWHVPCYLRLRSQASPVAIDACEHDAPSKAPPRRQGETSQA